MRKRECTTHRGAARFVGTAQVRLPGCLQKEKGKWVRLGLNGLGQIIIFILYLFLYDLIRIHTNKQLIFTENHCLYICLQLFISLYHYVWFYIYIFTYKDLDIKIILLLCFCALIQCSVYLIVKIIFSVLQLVAPLSFFTYVTDPTIRLAYQVTKVLLVLQ